MKRRLKLTDLERRFTASMVRSAKAAQDRLSIEVLAIALGSRDADRATKAVLSVLGADWLDGAERTVERAVLDGVAEGKKRVRT